MPAISEFLVQLFRLIRERIWLEVSSRLVTTQQVDLHKRFEVLLAIFLVSIFVQ